MGPLFNKEILDQLVSQMKQTLDTIYKLKESKQPNREWEVVAYRFKSYNTREGNYVIIDQNSLHWIPAQEDTEHYEIFSVKRLSDGEVFTVGDTVEFEGCSTSILGFRIDDDIWMMVRYSPTALRNILFLEKSKQVLFTTEDGQPVYKDQSFYYVDKQFGIHIYSADSAWTPKVDGLEFSTKEKAEEYVSENKKSISLADLREVIGSRDFVGSTFIINHIKDKLNLK